MTLIAILLMFLGGLLDGLTKGNTGALRAQRADFLVFSATAQDSLVRSRIDPAVRRRVERAPGVTAVGGLGSLQIGSRVPGHGPRDLVPVVLLGYALAPRGLPARPPARGEAYADDVLRSEGVRVGTVVRLGPQRTPIRVIGFVADTQYSGQATLWGSLAAGARRRMPTGRAAAWDPASRRPWWCAAATQRGSTARRARRTR